jgi:hypothetical protein
MSKLWRGIVRTIFWSYERGSWPYDVMVLVILAFVLLTPRSWFHDGPDVAAPQSTSVRLVSEGLSGTRTYRLDAMLLDPQKQTPGKTPELERKAHDVLSRNVADLNGRTFQVVHIVPVRGAGGAVESYDVTVRW